MTMADPSDYTAPSPSTPDRALRLADEMLGWLSELAGSAGLLLVAVSAIRLTAPNGALASLDGLFDGRTLLIGCAIAGEVVVFGLTPLGRRSGAQLNPAVTLLMWFRRGVDGLTAFGYVGAQITGSVVGVALGRLAWGGAVAAAGVQYGLLQPRPGAGEIETAAGELGMTSALLLTMVAVATARRPVAAPTLFAVIASMIWLGGGWTGASFNPIRNLAPAMFSGDLRFQAAYLAAPLLASVLVAGTFCARGPSCTFRKRSNNQKEDDMTTSRLPQPVNDFGGLPAEPLVIAEHEPALWEKRCHATLECLYWRGAMSQEEKRRAIEDLGTVTYTYYEKWALAAATCLMDKGLITQDELADKMDDVRARFGEGR
jgi:aquaporin Z